MHALLCNNCVIVMERTVEDTGKRMCALTAPDAHYLHHSWAWRSPMSQCWWADQQLLLLRTGLGMLSLVGLPYFAWACWGFLGALFVTGPQSHFWQVGVVHKCMKFYGCCAG